MILLDTSGLLAAIDRAQPAHEVASRLLAVAAEPLVLSPFVLAELDYLVTREVGRSAHREILSEVESGAYALAAFAAADVGEAMRVLERYADQDIGLTDASIVVLAGRLGTERVLTLDERHFRSLRTPSGQPFTVLPADAGP